ncbi:MAG: hypothetical protein HY036_10910 [Nitrospirae bacterium]|nr:hypothetical protein [Nitrospirota bacterium]MBI3353073.1 hypothetical protein [Nitrospirota bacterium]
MMREVRVRLKIGESRCIGVVELPPRFNRFSDFLNGKQDFLKLLEPHSTEAVNPRSILLVNKKNISYIQTIEKEYIKQPFPTKGTFFRVSIQLKRDETIRGLIFCSFEETDYPLEGILKQSGFFVNIKNPMIGNSAEKFNFLAVGKSNILTMEIDPKPVTNEKDPLQQLSINN